MSRLKQLATLSCVLICAAFIGLAPARAGGDVAAPVASHNKFVGWWELGGFYGTDDTSRGEIVLFTPLAQSATTLFFLDARGKLFEEDVQEANLALGYRQMLPSGWNLGLWAGWDIRDTEEDNTFHQVSFGVEALSERFDVRVNGYVPVTDPKASPGLAEVVLQGNNIFLIGGEEVALYGIDGEVGMLLFGRSRGGGGGSKDAPARAKRHELRGYVGGFWFDDDDAVEEVAGPKGRLEYRINDIVSSLPGSRLTIESELSYDEVRDTRFEIGARLRIPFGARGSDAALRTASLTAQELRMTDGLERDTDIITVQSKEENVFDALTGVNFDRAAVLQGGGDLQGTIDANGENSLIILDGGTTNGSFIVGPNQTLQGGGSTIRVTGVRSGTTANFKAPGAKPTITSNLNQAILKIDNNTHLAGLGIEGGLGAGGNNNGIEAAADGVSNVAITDTMIMDVGGDGIQFNDDHKKVLIKNVTIENANDEGIFFNDNNRNVSIYHTNIANVDDGIEFDNDNSNITIENTTITNSDSNAIDINNNNANIVITNTVIDTTDGEAISFTSGNSGVTIDTVTVRNSDNDGIDFDDSNANVLITNATVENIDDDGINFGGDNTNVTIANSTVTNADDDGIDFEAGGNSNVTIVNNVLTDIGNAGDDNGIEFTDLNTNVVIAGNTINGVFEDALQFGANNTVTIDDNIFAGTIGDDLLDVNGGGNTINGAGNINNAVIGGNLCEGAGNFVGTLEIGGVVIVDAGPPCV